MVKKVLITGISGFAGSHLADYLLKNKENLINGTYLSEKSLTSIAHIKSDINLRKIDLTHQKNTSDLISDIKPDVIYHLAALSSPADSFKDPLSTLYNNISAQVNVLEAATKLQLKNTRILIISSADTYGIVSKEDLPIDEETKFMPNSAYAVSKITQDFLGLQYFLSYRLNIIRVRPFNHIGPRQSPAFAVSSFAQKIAEIEKNKIEPVLFTGNLDTKRDFTDVRDMVRAYSLIIEKGNAGEVYNIGSGVSYKLSDIVEKLLSLSNVKIKIRNDPTLRRPSDTLELLCNSSKIKKVTGWEPQIPLEKALKDTLDYWRDII